MLRLVLIIPFLTHLLSCGKQAFPDYSHENGGLPYDSQEVVLGGEFSFLNVKSIRRFKISSLMWLDGNQFYARVVMEKGPQKIRFKQFIHRGSQCPDHRDDLNLDETIDYSEAITASGEILIPLDGNIENQQSGKSYFPSTNEKGSYYYSRSGSISKMLNDLRLPDGDLKDNISKLTKSENLDLERRVMILYGSSGDPLLPVACLIIKVRDHSRR